MYKKNRTNKTTIRVNDGYKGETIEEKVARIVNNKEPIKDGAPRTYTERKDGILPAHDIRTDRFDIAVEGMDKVVQMKLAAREERHKPKEPEVPKIDPNNPPNPDTKPGEAK